MFTLSFSRKFDKQFDKLKLDKKTSDKILDSILDLENGYMGNKNVKHLTNHQPEYRLRLGFYRVLFDIENSVIYIREIKHRREAY
jgi:mRNA interferase RelE/StbE